MENINLDVNSVLQTIIGQRATNQQAQAVIENFLRLILNRQTFTASDLQEALRPINNALGALMAGFEDLKAQGQKNTAQLQKVVDEVSGMASKLAELQAAGDAKIAEAVAAARAQDQVALDASLAEVQAIQGEQSALIERLDAFNADVPTEPNPPANPEAVIDPATEG